MSDLDKLIGKMKEEKAKAKQTPETSKPVENQEEETENQEEQEEEYEDDEEDQEEESDEDDDESDEDYEEETPEPPKPAKKPVQKPVQKQKKAENSEKLKKVDENDSDASEQQNEALQNESSGEKESDTENEVALLQNNGIFRRELLLVLNELVDVHKVNTQTLLDIKKKLIGEEDDSKKDSKKE